MREAYALVPFWEFDEVLLTAILKIYGRVARITDPCKNKIDPKHEIEGLRSELSVGHGFAEYRLGSALTMHSKIFLRSVRKPGGTYIWFDLDPNTSNDSQARAVKMREKFHLEVGKYISEKMLPSIPFDDFDETVFTEIIGIYARTAGINNPVGREICPRKEIHYLKKNLGEHRICDFTFRSLVHHLSKLRIAPVEKAGGPCVSFDFFLRAHPELKPAGLELRAEFLEKAKSYLASHKISG